LPQHPPRRDGRPRIRRGGRLARGPLGRRDRNVLVDALARIPAPRGGRLRVDEPPRAPLLLERIAMSALGGPAGRLAIEAVDLRKVYVDPRRGRVEALCGLDLDCRQGEGYGPRGPSGAGKTTAPRVLATLLAPTSGTARVDGIDVAADPLEVRRRIGFLSPTTRLYPRLPPRESPTYLGQPH